MAKPKHPQWGCECHRPEDGICRAHRCFLKDPDGHVIEHPWEMRHVIALTDHFRDDHDHKTGELIRVQ